MTKPRGELPDIPPKGLRYAVTAPGFRFSCVILLSKSRCPVETVKVESPYRTASEAAEYLRTTVQGIYALVKRGRLKPMPGSGKLLFTREALDACLLKRFRR